MKIVVVVATVLTLAALFALPAALIASGRSQPGPIFTPRPAVETPAAEPPPPASSSPHALEVAAAAEPLAFTPQP